MGGWRTKRYTESTTLVSMQRDAGDLDDGPNNEDVNEDDARQHDVAPSRSSEVEYRNVFTGLFTAAHSAKKKL